MHATVTAFLERLAADDRTSRRTVAKQKNGQRAPNRAFAKALDHALSISMGFGFDRFLPFASVSALREYERRYFAFVELPGAEPRANTRISCILDTRTKATRLELSRNHSQRNAVGAEVVYTLRPGQYWLAAHVVVAVQRPSSG